MIKGGKGGGKTITGLAFEERVDLNTLFEKIEDYSIEPTLNTSGSIIFIMIRRCLELLKNMNFIDF